MKKAGDARRGSAKLDRANAELHAPFDGAIAEVNIDPGDPSAIAGQAPIRIVDISTLHIDVTVNDVDIGRVSQGQAVKVIADAAPAKVYAGTVSSSAPAATTTGSVSSYLVNVALASQAGLRPGMSVRVAFAGA
jgi:HlyD family secretion protein